MSPTSAPTVWWWTTRDRTRFTAPELVVESGLTNNKIYNGDVPVEVSANDPAKNGVYSGLKRVTYTVYKHNGNSDPA